MFIKRIEIDGFKSYAQKQVVDQFDTMFNAITGLNGSGKSNILDAICFVLGITDLKCIRAENMNALVYKSGQAGITRASVTITFDNRNKNNGPMGYNDYDEIIVRRQVIVNGRTSYTINGSAMANSKVSDFFRSVGLNVNNPHFLIMQGRITKVLNMKPHEILGMIEEAAGTKMYDSKRAQAVAFMEKKQHKVEEIQNLLNNEIQPKVLRLKEEKQQFLTFQKLSRDIDILKKQIDAYEYWMYLQNHEKLTSEATTVSEQLAELEQKVDDLKVEEGQISAQIADMEARKAATGSEQQKQLHANLAEVKEARVNAEADRDTISQQLTEAQTEIDRLIEESTRERITLDETRRKLRENENNLGGEEDCGKQLEKTIATCKAKLDALDLGLSTDDDGQAVTLETQITNTRTALTEMSTRVKTAQMKKTKIEPKLKDKKRELEKMSKQSTTDTRELEQCENDVRRCEGLLQRSNFDAPRYDALTERIPQVKREITVIDREMERYCHKFNFLNFHYHADRVWAGFDEEAEIVGPVASLFKPKDMHYAAALDVICASQLFNVVFSHQQTAASFIDQNLMAYRRTIIPLDKIMTIDIASMHTRIATAKKICQEQGQDFHMAIDLIEFDPKYTRIMEFIFRGICVTSDAKFASQLAFNPSTKLRVVTTDGDDVRPSGAMIGGKQMGQENKEPMLVRLSGYYDLCCEKKRLIQEVRELEKEKEQLDAIRGDYYQIRQQFDRANGRLDTLRDSLKNSPVGILREEIAQMEQELPEHEAAIVECQEKTKELSAKIKELEDRKKNEKDYKAAEKKKYEKEKKEAEDELKRMKKSYDKARDTLERLRKEVEKVQTTIQQQEAEVNALQTRKEELSAELNGKEKAVQDAFKAENARQGDMDRFMAELKEKDNQIKKARGQEDKIRKSLRDSEVEVERLERQRKKHLEDAHECKRLAAHIKKSCKTIADIEHSLGKDGDYSFKGFEKDKAAANLKKLSAEKENLGRTLNPQAHAVLDNAEAQVNDLIAKTDQINKDRRTLDQTIETLDEKKRKEIMKAYEQVNKDFGHIFSTLLKDTSAKLEPPKGKSPLDGLEIKVCFSKQWKDSLSELSGGQRSLVAISLVLAMLKFKPAPIYILDEVDAALDASHTANIGTMIRNHFTASQFIIVSLKDGMFKNANILFKTSFVDGTSKVTRTKGLTEEEMNRLRKDEEKSKKAAEEANKAPPKQKQPKDKENK